MEPASKHWLNELLRHLRQSIDTCKVSEIEQLYFAEDKLGDFTYRILHKTGIVFSYPLDQYVKNHPQIDDWGDADLMKIVFAEMMMNVSIFSHRQTLRDEGFDAVVPFVLDDLDKFYSSLHPNSDYLFKKGIFHQTETSLLRIERFFDLRMANKSVLTRSFWSGVLYNAFLFLDAVVFAQFIEEGREEVKKGDFMKLKKIIIELSLCAIHVNGQVERAETLLFKFFLDGAELPSSEERFYANLLDKGMTTMALDIPNNLPLLQKKVVMEMCIIATMADSHFGAAELQYLQDVAKLLDLADEELEQSIIFTQSFVLKNASKVVYFQNRSSLRLLGRSLNNRMSAMMRKNRANIRREISESKELMELLWKSQNQSLTPEEREKVKRQVADLIKTIPSMAIFMVPGGSILLPLLLKFLPDAFVKPSSFRNSAADDKPPVKIEK